MSDKETNEVVFVSSGLDKLVKSLETASKASDRASKSVTRQGRAARYTQGPYQRLIRLSGELSRAHAAGNVPAVMDIQNAITQANKQIGRLQPKAPKTFAQKAAGVLRSSRFGAGGVMPLVGQTLDLLGPEGAAIALMAEAAYKAATAIGEMTAQAAEATRSFGNLQLATGGTGRESGLLKGIGGALGMSPEQIGGLSASLQESMTSNPLSMAAAAQAGIAPIPRPYNQTDEAQNLLKVVEYLRNIRDDQSAIRYARTLGPVGEQLLPLRNLSDQQFAAMQKAAAVQGQVMDKGAQQGAQDFQSASQILSDAFDNLKSALTQPLARDMAATMDSIAESVNKAALSSKKNQAVLTGVEAVLFGGGLANPAFAVNAARGDAQDKHTEAMEKHTDALNKASAPGVYGHSERMDRAVPSGFGYGNGAALQQQLQAGAFNLGAL